MAERRSSQTRLTANCIGALVQIAVRQFVALSGETPERVLGDDGWSVLVDVVELEHVPSTTSVMCAYRLDLDGKAHPTGFERIRGFTQASTGGR